MSFEKLQNFITEWQRRCVTANRRRELYDHLLQSHFKHRIRMDMPDTSPRNTKCPECDYVAPDVQIIQRQSDHSLC